jgi:hypothetical protein
MDLRHAIERMDHFPSEALLVTHAPGFVALQALAAERGADDLLASLPLLAEVRHDVGRQVVGLVTAEAMFVGALAAASATRQRGAPVGPSPATYEALAEAAGLAASGNTPAVRLQVAEVEAPGLADLLRFAAARLAGAASRADERLAAALVPLTEVAQREVERGAAAELFLAGSRRS